MVGDMVQTVSRVLDMADGDPLNVAKEMMYGTYSVATRGAGLALDLTTIVLGVRGLKTQTRRAADGVSQRVNATIDGFLRGFRFTPPVLAGKPRPNILGSAKTFQWKRPDGTTDTHHVWFEGTRDGKVTLHIASTGGTVEANELKESISKVERAFQSTLDRLKKRASSKQGNTYDTKVHSGRTLRGLLGKALQDFVDIVEQMKTTTLNREKAKLRVRLEKNPGIGQAINYSHGEKIGLEVLLVDYLNLDTRKYLDDHWGQHMSKTNIDFRAGPSGAITTAEKQGTWTKTYAESKRRPQDRETRIHAHHIVMRNGSDGASTHVKDTKEILIKYGLTDPDHSWWNLIWAPNRGHTTTYSENVLKSVRVQHAENLRAMKESELKKDIDAVSSMQQVVMEEGRKFFYGRNTGEG